jgi:D-alanyl-D-alanine dipeptidase
MEFDYTGRLGRIEGLMEQRSIDALLLSVGPDLPYFTGYEAMASERLTMLVIRPGEEPILLVPRLEAPRVAPGPFDLRAWDETDDPIALVSRALTGARRIAVGDQTWTVFVVELQHAVDADVWTTASHLTKHLRMRKEPIEIEALRQVAEQADRVAMRIPDEIQFKGSTEHAVSARVRNMLIEEGHEQALFAIVASGPNGASPHHEPGERVIGAGDMIVLDFGGSLGGYRSDTTRTFVVDEPTDQQREVHLAVLEANTAGRATVAPGVRCEEIDRAARGVIEDSGFGKYFVHRTGHGIGLEVHEHPYIVEGNSLPLESGMVFSIEPGIYLPGEFGVRIEDIVTVTSDGIDVLNESPRGLQPVR